MLKIYQSVAAKRDLIEHYVYLAENAGIDTAERFLVNTEASLQILTSQPMVGATLILKSSKFNGLRKWHIKDFDNYLIFYMPRLDGITIIRVLHAASDWWRLLGIAVV